ncbi:MAG: thioredoxin domain-containing protein [Candidatus Omnitrophota bacterium]|jgi:protein-disulfide isomerase
MKKSAKKFLTLAVFSAGVAVIVVLRQFSPLDMGIVSLSDSSRTKGNPSATIHIIEYLDYGCPACVMGAQMLEQYMNRFPGKIAVTLRYFPLHGETSSVYAECAARQNKFWEFSETIFSQYQEWRESPDREQYLIQIAETVGLNKNILEACRQDERILALVKESKTQGQEKGVKSTPTYFVNGQMFVGTKALKDMLDKQLQ